MINIYCFFIIILLPFWTLPFIPGSLKPISIFLILPLSLLYFFYTIKNKKQTKIELMLFVFIFISNVYSIILYLFCNFTETQFFMSLMIFNLGASSFFGFKYIFNKYGTEWFIKIINYSILLVVFFGWLELLSYLHVLPNIVKEIINLSFAGKGTSRIMLTVSEPAWASRLVSCLLPFAWYIYKQKKSNKNLFNLISLGVFFLFCFSLTGFSLLIFCVLINFILKVKVKTIIKTISILSLLIILLNASYELVKNDGGYFVSRIDKLSNISISSLTIDDLAYIDGSSMIRVGYPIIATQIFMNNPMGVGIGLYGEYFNNEINNYSNLVKSNPQVVNNINNHNGDQRSFYLKILSELGIVGGALFFSIWIIAFKNISKITDKEKRNLCYLLWLVSLANMVQMGSFLFPFYWISLGMIEVSTNEN